MTMWLASFPLMRVDSEVVPLLSKCLPLQPPSYWMALLKPRDFIGLIVYYLNWTKGTSSKGNRTLFFAWRCFASLPRSLFSSENGGQWSPREEFLDVVASPWPNLMEDWSWSTFWVAEQQLTHRCFHPVNPLYPLNPWAADLFISWVSFAKL